jgi:hypothetical protein
MPGERVPPDGTGVPDGAAETPEGYRDASETTITSAKAAKP